MEEQKRPTLSDPKEWAIIRHIYFNDTQDSGDPDKVDIDPLELNDRINHRSNRNQSR